jgi:putative CocE/NonD family hydrolase
MSGDASGVKIVEDFPRRVRCIENAWIPLADGTRLAARIWLPEDAGDDPVPAILEYIPYRKRDYMRGRDQPMHHYFAGHGYAAVRVDMRGSGESDGLLHDEYLPQEQADALEVIAWLAAQPWCSGAVGMMGKSWGGFNALQAAALRPPALKAVVTLCSTDDRYARDVHYMGGCLIKENLWWGAVMHVFNARPPDPAIVGEGWREAWLARLEAETFWPETWFRHQARDAYWKQGSVCEDFSAIACPVYAMGGWMDAYAGTVFRLLEGLEVPRKGWIGPWAHLYPHEGAPQPAAGFLQEALRWWDQWLKDEDTGVMDEPMLRVWMQDSVPPAPHYEHRPGRWVAEEAWPSTGIETRTLALNRRTLDDAAGPEMPLALASPQSTGAASGDWSGFAIIGDIPLDQRIDDGGSLTFESAPLTERLEILGAPAVTLDLAADRPNALVSVRLSDVASDGAAARVTHGVLNLTHRDGHETPVPLEPGRRYRVRVDLNHAAHAFPAGHRLRVAVSNAYWPLLWPSPEAVRLTLFAGAGRLDLPVRPPRPGGEAAPPPGPESAPPVARTTLREGRIERGVTRDLLTGEVVHRLFIDGGVFGPAGLIRIDEIEQELGHVMTCEYRIRDDDPLSARAEVVQSYVMARGDWRVRIEARAAMSADAQAFHLAAGLEAYEGEEQVFARTWDDSIPREGV